MGLEHVRQYQCRTSPTTQASLGEKNHCSSAWPAAVIGQSLPTSTIPFFMTCASDGSLHNDALPLTTVPWFNGMKLIFYSLRRMLEVVTPMILAVATQNQTYPRRYTS